MRFWTFATVLIVVALVITDVSAKKSNRDKKTAKSGKQKQNDYHGSRESEDFDVLRSEKKAKQMFSSKDRKRRSIEEEEPKYEKNEYIAAAGNAKPQKDKQQTKATIEVEQVEHQSGKRKTEPHKKSGKPDKLRKSEEITQDAVGSTEDHVPNGKKDMVKGNLEKASKSQGQEHDVRSSSKKDEQKSEKSRVSKKEKIMKVEKAATDEMEKNEIQKMQSMCNDDSITEEQVEFENSQKCTCNEDVHESIEKDDVQAEAAEELESCTERKKFKKSKYSERTRKENCKAL